MAKNKKPATKKPVKKTSAVKKVVKKAIKKSSPKKATPKKASVKKVAPMRAAAKKVAPKKAAAKKLAPQKTAAAKSTPAKAFVTHTTKKIDLRNFVTPLDDRVMVQLAPAEKMTAGGLYIPDSVMNVSGNLEGLVVSIGRGHRNKKGHVRPMDLKVGDKVLFSEYAGSKIKIQDQDLLIIREADVLGVIA